MKSLAPSRVQGRARAASLFAEAARACVARGAQAATLRAVAHRLEVSHTQVERWADPLAGRALALGDVLALPRELAREILGRCLASLEEPESAAPRRTLAEITIALGRAVHDLEGDLADGRMDDRETHRAHLCRIGTLALRGMLALGEGGRP